MSEIEALRPFYAMEIMAQAQQWEREGRHIHHLEIGEPSAGPAPQVRAAARAAVETAQGYTAAKGQPVLRARLAQYYQEQHGAQVAPDHVLVTLGSSAGFILSFLSAFAPGDKIALTRPGYPAYPNIVHALGFQTVDIALSAGNGWTLTADQIEAAHAQEPFAGLLFASPANPTGARIDDAGMARIVAVCARLGIRLISDEIYHGLSYDARDVSAREHTDDAIIVNSFSKYYCMTGWRVGWLVLPADLVRGAEMRAQSLFISASSLSQSAGLAALDAKPYYEAERARYAENRTLLTQGLRALGFGVPQEPEGAFYVYADASAFSTDTMAFCRDMLDVAGVAATPGLDFDRVDGQSFVRFSYAGARETIAGALDALKAWLGVNNAL